MCICEREGFNGLGLSDNGSLKMSLELDIPDEGYKREGIEPALLVSLYHQKEEMMDNIRISVSYCPFCGRKII